MRRDGEVWDDATGRNVREQLPCPRGSTYTSEDTSSAGAQLRVTTR